MFPSKTLLTASILLIAQLSMAQSKTLYNHNAFWGRVQLSDNITSKIKWEVLLQARTQNNPDEKSNIFAYHQLTSYWLQLHYQVSKELRVSFTPFCYFSTVGLFPQSVEAGGRGIKEYRWTLQAEHTLKLPKLTYSNRYGIEYRNRDLFTPGDYVPNFRVRYRGRLEKSFGPVAVFVYDEVFLEFGKAVRASAAIFTQNRLSAGLTYEVVKNIKITPAYVFVVQERASGKEVDKSNVFWFGVSFDNVFSQFKKKDSK